MAYHGMSNDYSSPFRESDQQSLVLKSLTQVAPEMHHIDELWLWLAQAVVSHFEIQIAQIWATQANQIGQLFPELRSMACRDTALPQNIVVNTYVRDVAQSLLHTRHSSPAQRVDSVFPRYLAIVLKRHGLNYCANYFLGSPLLLPPANDSRAIGRVPTPLGIILIVFIQHYPAHNVLPSIDLIFRQSLIIATQQALLFPVGTDKGPFPGKASTTFPLPELIPRRNEDPLSNPIATGMAISDKRMRRLYAEIDDQTSVGELSRRTQFDLKEIARMLQVLVTQRQVLMYEPSGRRVDPAQLLYSDDL